MLKLKKRNIMILSIILVFALSLSSFAAAQTWTAQKPSYDTYVNGIKMAGTEIMNISGTTYIKPGALEQFGISKSWNGTQADFTIPVANQGSKISYSKLCKTVVDLYSGNNYVGNGVFVAANRILTTKNVWTYGNIKAKNSVGDTLQIKPVPIKNGERLILLETTGATTSNYATIGDSKPAAGDEVSLICSLVGVKNLVNFSTVKDYFDFNWLTTGDKEYLRTYNNNNQWSQGAGLFDDNGELVGMYIYQGANYALFVTLKDITAFLD